MVYWRFVREILVVEIERYRGKKEVNMVKMKWMYYKSVIVDFVLVINRY